LWNFDDVIEMVAEYGFDGIVGFSHIDLSYIVGILHTLDNDFGRYS
jgi:hypothetical protein